jgi:methionyl-tRNA formyltransferase
MYMDKGLDTGDMILKKEFEIDEKDTYETLHDKMSAIGAKVLIETLRLIEEDRAPRIPQEHNKYSYAPMLEKGTGRIDWSKSAREIYNLIRGTYPWPGAYSSYMGKKFKIFSSEIYDENKANSDYGYISEIGRDYLMISCSKGFIKIFELQFENEKRMGVEAYLRGHSLISGSKLA